MYTDKSEVLLVGGGVVGISSAYFLSKMGAHVTVIDSGQMGSGCSYANGGLIVPSHSIPLASPGMVTKGLLSLLSPFRPFSFDLKDIFRMFPWLLSFAYNCRSNKLENNLNAICELATHSKDIYEKICISENLNFDFEKKGMLLLFQKQKSFASALKYSSLLQAQGVVENVLNQQQVKQMEPAVTKTVGGIFYPNDAHLDPNKYITSMVKLLKKNVCFKENTQVTGFEYSSTKISAVKTTRGNFRADKIVICAGALTKDLFKSLQKKIPLQAAQGHSLVVEKNSYSPTRPLILEDAKITVTPYSRGTRYSGLLNLCSPTKTLSTNKTNRIKKAVNCFLKDPVYTKNNAELWCGYRPCTPDGVPIISRVSPYPNLFVSTGHAMLGMTLGPMSGKLIAELVLDKLPSMRMSTFSLSRF
jgi:D-amino-acid dehydrogenase